MKIYKILLLMRICLFCGLSFSAEQSSLKVALLPCIVDAADDNHQSIFNELQKNYMSLSTSGLDIRPINPLENFYDISFLKSLFLKESCDVIEIDGLLLQSLINEDLIDPWSAQIKEERHNWHSAAHKVCFEANDELWGVPHWLCSYFLFGPDPSSLNGACSIENYCDILEKNGTNKPFLAIDLLGKYTSSSLYLSSYASKEFKNNVCIDSMWNTAISCLENSAILPLKIAAKACLSDNSLSFNMELHTYYHSHLSVPAKVFATKEAYSYCGYSETLYYAFKFNSEQDIYFRSLPFHANIERKAVPTVFVDVFVLRKGLSEEKRNNAVKFIETICSDRMYKYITLSKDKADKLNRIPRYLIPAWISPLNKITEKNHKEYSKYYKTFQSEISEAIPYPKAGLPEKV